MSITDQQIRSFLARVGDAAPPAPDLDHLLGRATPGTATGQRRSAPRTLAAIAAGVLVVVGVAAVAATQRESSRSSLPATAPDTPIAERPMLMPALPEDDPRNATVSGSYGSFGPDGADVIGLVARVDGDVISNGMALQVFASGVPEALGIGDHETVTVDGVTYDVYRESGTPVITTVVLRGSPAIAISGVDPFDFIDSAGIPVIDVVVADNTASFSIGDLPEGYEIIVAPEPAPNGTVFTQINVPGPSGGEGSFAEVQLGSPLPGAATVGTFRRVDINGTSGWINSRSAYVVYWQIDDRTWAQAVTAGSAQDALEFARDIEFIDEATWRSRYRTEPPPVRTPGAFPEGPVSTIVTSEPTDSPELDS